MCSLDFLNFYQLCINIKIKALFLCIPLFFYFIFLSLLSQSEFCGDKPKSGAKYGLPDSLAILSEMGEVTDGVMDNKVKSGSHIKAVS